MKTTKHQSPFYLFTTPSGDPWYVKIDAVRSIAHVADDHPAKANPDSQLSAEERARIKTIIVTDHSAFVLQEPVDDVARRLNHDVRGTLNGTITDLQKIYNQLQERHLDGDYAIAEQLEHLADVLLEALEAIYGEGARVKP